LRTSRFVIFVILIVVMLFFLYQLNDYRAYQNQIPRGISLAGIPVGGKWQDEALELLGEAFSEPVKLNYLNESLQLHPQDVGFQLKADEMLEEVNRLKTETDFWQGFSDFVLRKPGPSVDVPLQAQYSEDDLRKLLSEIAASHDQPLQDPQPVLENLSFSPGQEKRVLDVEASLPKVIAALTSAEKREVDLVVDTVEPPESDIKLLRTLLEKRLADFPGIGGIFIKNLKSGKTLAINADVAFAGMSILKVAIVEESYRYLDELPDAETTKLISETLTSAGNYTSNLLLSLIGDGDPYQGAKRLTESLHYLGLENTFMATPYDAGTPPPTIVTPANSRQDKDTQPDPYVQTTPKDAGRMMEMIYQCAQGGGSLIAAYPEDCTPEKCQEMLSIMETNHIGTLLETGLPEGTRFAHKHGWIDDTHGDVGVVFSGESDYVISVFLHRPVWLESDLSHSLMADISKATYNYFNLDIGVFGS
jgi:beta-lactamase class A